MFYGNMPKVQLLYSVFLKSKLTMATFKADSSTNIHVYHPRTIIIYACHVWDKIYSRNLRFTIISYFLFWEPVSQQDISFHYSLASFCFLTNLNTWSWLSWECFHKRGKSNATCLSHVSLRNNSKSNNINISCECLKQV